MQWAWATTLDELWRSPSLPMWATLVAAAFFALVVLIVLLRADRTMANGALAVIALLAIGIASTATVRGLGTSVRPTDLPMDARVSSQQVAVAPALACLDGLAGESVEAACEKAVFGSADTAAAAVSYTAGQVSRVIAASNARSLTPEQQLLRRTVERDRYGLVAQVITVRERCVATDCPLFRALTDTDRIKANMNDRLYDTLVARYSPSWNSAAADPALPAANLLTGVPPGANMPTGKPTSVDFANSSAIPPISIMGSEPPGQPTAPAAAPAPKQTAPAASKSTNAQAQAKRPQANAGQSRAPPAAVGRPRVVAPVPFVPSQPGDKN